MWTFIAELENLLKNRKCSREQFFFKRKKNVVSYFKKSITEINHRKNKFHEFQSKFKAISEKIQKIQNEFMNFKANSEKFQINFRANS